MTAQTAEEEAMDDRDKGSTRRQFLKTAGVGAAGVVAAGSGFAAVARGGGNRSLASSLSPVYSNEVTMALAATDGHIVLPNRPSNKPVYIFGFIHVPAPPDAGSDPSSLGATYKGNAQHPAPILGFRQYDPATGIGDVRITLTNLGFVGRPDLVDSHTIHWHGFRAPVAVMDGVPEVSIAVPQQRQFTYFYRPHDPGTYMYHCHFEDVEHVQMGMTSIVFVRPLQGDKFVYNDGDGSTAFDREYAILVNEIWTEVHDNDEDIQETIETDYKPNYFTFNGRVYPQTIVPSGDPSLPSQPISSLVQCNGGDKVLFRLANLGYQQHALQLPGIPMKVVGEDATLLRSPGGADLSYQTNTIYIGPGTARDVIFVAPAYNPSKRSSVDARGAYNLYFFKNRSAWKLSNDGAPGLGGMMTEVRVYQNPLPAQSQPNETYA
jgi:FtsP/CotA-like multicopper oxidase with cupredoxin domain